MNKIFIEAKNGDTPECHFLKAILTTFFPEKEVMYIPMDGIGNLFTEPILNQIALAQDSGEQVMVFTDADTLSKGWGYDKRKKDIEKGMLDNRVSFSYFIYPNNQDDGDVEVLMEKTARRDIHHVFFDCFEDYEKCVSGLKDESGQPIYHTPDLKGKLHTYMSAQRLNNKQRRKLGTGNWLFGEEKFWNLNVADLQPLKDFLAANLR